MEFLFIVGIVLLLYSKTLSYFRLIDDFVKREGYYNFGIVQAPAQIFLTKPSEWYRVFMIGMHIVNCWIIYLLWGFNAALIFAVHPMSVWCTAWVTGNYYATAAFFTLVSYYILHQFPNIWGALVAMPIFNAAINSTVCPMAFPFLAVFEPWIASLGLMVVWFLKSDRWKTAMEVRNTLFIKPARFDWRRPILMTKVVARYTFEAIFPIKTALFVNFFELCRDNEKQYEEAHKCDVHFWASLALITSVFVLGMILNPFAICWFFIIISLHSQFGLTGQFYAQRYLYLAMVGMCIVIAKLSAEFPFLFFLYIFYLLFKTIRFIPKFKDMDTLFRSDIENNQEWDIAYTNLAQHLSKFVGNEEEIEKLLLKAHSINPDTWVTQFNLAKLYIIRKDYEKSLVHVNNAIKCGADERSMEIFKQLKSELEEVTSGKRSL